MKTINRVLGRVVLIFTFIILTSQTSVWGEVSTVSNTNFSITSNNTINSSGWNLNYSASENGFKITLLENKGEKVFTVRSKFFEIAYVLNKHGFGARMIKGGQSEVPSQILNQILNQDALKQQEIISDASINNEMALNLIASYLPDLININYKHLVR